MTLLSTKLNINFYIIYFDYRNRILLCHTFQINVYRRLNIFRMIGFH